MPNPRTKEFPLRHSFGMHFQLLEEDAGAVDFATTLPMIVADQAKTESVAQDVQVNPANDAFGGFTRSPNCFMNSRINNIKITEYVMIPAATDVPDMLYNKAIISWGLGDHAVVDPVGLTLLAELGFEKNADTIGPLYTDVDLTVATLLDAEVDGLDTTQKLENVALEPHVLRLNRNRKLGPKVRKLCIGPFINRVHKDFPFYSSRWYQVPGNTKRMNAFTGCFMYLGLNKSIASGATNIAAEAVLPHFTSDTTVDEPSLSFHYLFEYNEYNDSFDSHA